MSAIFLIPSSRQRLRTLKRIFNGLQKAMLLAHDSSALPIHRLFLAKNIVLIENLVNLEKIPAGEFVFCCLPLKIAEADGAPVRAIALCNGSDKKK